MGIRWVLINAKGKRGRSKYIPYPCEHLVSSMVRQACHRHNSYRNLHLLNSPYLICLLFHLLNDEPVILILKGILSLPGK